MIFPLFYQDEFFSGPEPESMVASACLLSLLGPDNYLTIHILQDSYILSRIISRPSQTSRPALIDLNVDLGPLVVCLCPSQMFWLGVMITQLTKLFEAYNTVQKAEEQVEDDYGPNNLVLSRGGHFVLTQFNVHFRHRIVFLVGSGISSSC